MPDTDLEYLVENHSINSKLFDGLVDLMEDYELYDVLDLVDSLGIEQNKVWLNLKLYTIEALLASHTNKMMLAKDVKPLAWLGGPPRKLIEGEVVKPKLQLMRGSLMHYIIDVILRRTLEQGSNESIMHVAASRLVYEG